MEFSLIKKTYNKTKFCIYSYIEFKKIKKQIKELYKIYYFRLDYEKKYIGKEYEIFFEKLIECTIELCFYFSFQHQRLKEFNFKKYKFVSYWYSKSIEINEYALKKGNELSMEVFCYKEIELNEFIEGNYEELDYYMSCLFEIIK